MNHRQQYLENGYCIYRSMIKPSNISSLLCHFEIFKQHGGIYFSQSNHNWRKTINDLDEYGLLEKSIEDFTDLIWAPKLSNSGKDILLSETIHSCLIELSGKKQDFCMWQNMLFDKSTGTVDHIDSWYLDTDPMGYLIAAWVALEDIDGNGGEFHVYPGSHLSTMVSPDNWKSLNHDQFVNWSENIRKEFHRKPIHLNAGDILFWHPSLLHGSSKQKAVGHSRKSLTAHYYPVDLLKGGNGNLSNISKNMYQKAVAENRQKMRKFYSHPIYSRRRRDSIRYSTIGALKFLLNFQNHDSMLMDRSNYTAIEQ